MTAARTLEHSLSSPVMKMMSNNTDRATIQILTLTLYISSLMAGIMLSFNQIIERRLFQKTYTRTNGLPRDNYITESESVLKIKYEVTLEY